MPFQKRNSLNFFPAWIILGAALLVLATAIGLDLYFAHNAITIKERDRLGHQSDVVASNISHHLQSTSNALGSIRQDLPKILGPQNGLANVNELLKTMTASMAGVRSILLVDANGNCTASNRRELIGMNFYNSERFQMFKRGSDSSMLYLSPPFRTPLDVFTISVGRVILNEQGEFNGYLHAIFDPEYFTIVLKSVIYAPDMRAGLVHEGGKVIFRVPDPENLTGADIPSIPIPAFKHFIDNDNKKSTFAEVELPDAEQRLIAFRSVIPTTTPANARLVVALSRDKLAMYAGWRSDAINRGGLFAALAFISITGLLLHQRRQIAYARLQDIREAERVQNEASQMESADRFRLQSQHLEEVIWGTDAGTWEWNVQSDEAVLNDRWAQMLGYSLDELRELCQGNITRTCLAQLIHPDGIKLAGEQMGRCFSRESDIFDCEVQMRHKNGGWIWVLARGRVVEWSEDGKPLRMSGTHQDINERKLSEEKLGLVAHYDLLTGLPNRALLADRLQQAIALNNRLNTSLAVAYLDLDGFKEVNDRHGHDIGDKLLVAIAKRLKSTLREADTLSRIGGDEFVAVLIDMEHFQNCWLALDRILVAAAEPVIIDGILLTVSASIGVTLAPPDKGDADQLLRHADQAMYLAKQAGKNRYHLFDVDQAAAIEIQQENIKQIRQGIERNEFVLYYQPKVNMNTGEVIGAEALIRWQHPEQGLLPPSSFLPIIENHHISIMLGEWVINAALAQMVQWQTANIHIPVSVNVSAYQLLHDGFSSRVTELLAAHPSIQPHNLELEILETSALDDITRVSEIMHACRKIGVSFALDDFGTGYSSLTYLKSLPADLLKIDQTFVRDILDDPDDLAIVEGVMGLAKAFRRHAIAEGVETVAHGELLLSLGCELAQGFAIARPMPAVDLPFWMASWQPDASWIITHEQSMDSDARMITYVEVKHRHWQNDIADFLSGLRDAPPYLDADAGRFDHWLNGDGYTRYHNQPEFHLLVELHKRLHARGSELVRMHNDGQTAEAREGLAQLQFMREALIAKLQRLVHND